MSAIHRPLLILVPALALFGACGGSDGDSDDSGDSGNGAASSPAASNDDATRSSNGSAGIPAIKDGTFGDGEVHVEISGDKQLKLDVKGNGMATGGFALLTFASEDAAVTLTLQAGSKEAPGALSITTADLATAGEWGTACTVNIDDGANELKGEFGCKEIEAVDPKTVKTYKLRISGDFSLPR